MARDPDRGVLDRLGVAGQENEPGDRRFRRGHSWCDPATHAVAEHEHARRIHFGLLLEQPCGRPGVMDILVDDGEFRVAGELLAVCVGDFVEADARDAARRQSPGQILERLVRAGRAVSVPGATWPSSTPTSTAMAPTRSATWLAFGSK
jgi:hypothetical protein